jgi:MSHA biogenesis protein MshE
MGNPEKIRQRIRLGEIFLQQRLLTEEQLEAALSEQKRTGGKLGRVCIDSGYLSEDQVSVALARELQVPFIDLKHIDVTPDLVMRLPETLARRFKAIVLEETDGDYSVGFADPTDLFAFDEITRTLKRDIRLAVVSESLLLQTIDRIYRRTEEISGLALELGAELGDSAIDLGGVGLLPGIDDAPVVKLLQSVFEDASGVRASDVHIEPQEKQLQIRFRIDGVLHVQTEVDAKIASALVLRLKLMSGLDISEKRMPQDGRFSVKVRNAQIDVRISTLPTQHGESVVMRLLNQSSGILKLDNIGLPPKLLEKLRKTMDRLNGMVLVTGPTGSGKTTTLYAILEELNTPVSKIITVEDPVEYRLPGINQVQVHDKIDLSFERVLRTALRQDPDVILVGEMRDQITVETGLRASMTGHLVLSTLHTNDAISTPIRLLDMGAPAYMVAMSLQVVVAQRLLRLVCESCGEVCKLTPQEEAWLSHNHISKGRRANDSFGFRKGRGCTHCNGTGFLGRTGVYEMLEMTTPLVAAANNADPAEFVAAAREQIEGETLIDHAIDLVFAGRTTLAEAMRVSVETD